MAKWSFRVTSGAVLLTVATMVATITAQDRPAAQPGVAAQPGANASPGAPQAPAAQYRVKQLLGSKVHIDGNVAVGTVDDLVFDDNGQVEYLIVLNQGKLVTVPWEAAKFNFEKRMATINITQERFQQIPTYTTEQYPTFTAPNYQTQTYQYYGLTPGQQRRLNRRL